jgi:hypothetical protein
MREPSPLIIQRDDMECETLCTAQLLFMHGKLELSELPTLNRRIGREAGEPDGKAGNLRLLFEAGFHIVEVQDFDLRKFVSDTGYAHQIWAGMGYRHPEQIRRLLREAYPTLRERGLRKLALVEQYSDQFTLHPRDATQGDLDAMLARRWQVTCLLPRMSGYSHDVLAVGEKKGKYRVFDPLKGVLWVRKAPFVRQMRPNLVGYHLSK